MRPASMTTVWPVMVVRQIATTMSAQSSLSAAFFSSEAVRRVDLLRPEIGRRARTFQQTRGHAIHKRLGQRHRHERVR